MNSFDFSLYDTGDVSKPVKKSKEEPKEEFDFSAYEQPVKKEFSFLDTVKDYGKTTLKGFAEGLGRLGRMMGPLEGGPSSEEQLQSQTESLNKLLPTEEGFGQAALRRGLQQAPSMISLSGSPVQAGVRSILAGFLGEGAKELGAPEWAQSAAEITAFLGPDVAQKLIASGNNKQLIQTARRLGMSDEAITPLVQSDFKKKWLGKLVPRRGKTQAILKKSQEEIGNIYEALGREQNQFLKGESVENLSSTLDQLLFEMPSGVRSKIREDLADLVNHPITPRTLMNFWKDINHAAGKNSKELTLLKEPIKNAIREIDPAIASDFETANELYSKYAKIAGQLEPNLMTDLISAGQAISTFVGIFTGNYGLLSEGIGGSILRKGAQKLLLSPRFQQMGRKTVSAINQHKFPIVKKMIDLYAHELKKDAPEISNQLENISQNEIESAITNQE
jgi:hypothetical protein